MILAKHGFTEVRRHASHIMMHKQSPAGSITVPVPDHKEIRAGTLRAIIRQSQINRSEFES